MSKQISNPPNKRRKKKMLKKTKEMLKSIFNFNKRFIKWQKEKTPK